MLDNKTVLITGGTGSFGKAFVKYIITNYPGVKKIIIYSRDEQKQFQMALDYPKDQFNNIRFFIGDVRDFDRLKMAMGDVDYVIHAAAMKHVHIAEYNPIECIKTNINGAENVINASLECGAIGVVALSTDKAAAPVNLYGATKLASDKLFIAANNITGQNPIKFSVVRYGNVMGSNGSVIPYFLSKKSEGFLPITNVSMTRFNITLIEGVKMVIHALEKMWGGEIYVPKIPSYNVLDLANAIDANCEKRTVGPRPGEKIHEEMITESDAFYSYDMGTYYVILPITHKWNLSEFIDYFGAIKVDEGFQYNSGKNPDFLSIDKLKTMISNL